MQGNVYLSPCPGKFKPLIKRSSCLDSACKRRLETRARYPRLRVLRPPLTCIQLYNLVLTATAARRVAGSNRSFTQHVTFPHIACFCRRVLKLCCVNHFEKPGFNIFIYMKLAVCANRLLWESDDFFNLNNTKKYRKPRKAALFPKFCYVS